MSNEYIIIKQVILEQQTFPESVRKDRTKDKIFITGIPNGYTINGENTDDADEMVHHILECAHTGISRDKYKILENLTPIEGYTRHSAKIYVNDVTTKSELFIGCRNFKDLEEKHPPKNARFTCKRTWS